VTIHAFQQKYQDCIKLRDIVIFLYYYCCVPTYSIKLLLYVIYSANSRLTYILTYLLILNDILSDRV